ncbi:unnamed protein product, partial [Ectocarpus sp. 12 AP-2014]
MILLPIAYARVFCYERVYTVVPCPARMTGASMMSSDGTEQAYGEVLLARFRRIRWKNLHSSRKSTQVLLARESGHVNHSRVRSTLRSAPEPVRTECFRRLTL